MSDYENRNIYLTRQRVLNLLKDAYLECRSVYLENLDLLIKFTTTNNFKYLLKCECGEVHLNDDYSISGLHERFGIDNTTRLLDLVQNVNDSFDLYERAYVRYYLKRQEYLESDF